MEAKSQIQIIQDTYQDVSISIINKYLADNFMFSVVGVQCRKDNFWAFIESLNTDDTTITHKFEVSPNNKVYYVEEVNKKFLIICEVGFSDIYEICIYGLDIKETERLYKEFKKFEHTDNETNVNFITFSLNGNKISDYNITLKLEDFKDDVEEYYPYINTEELFKQFTESNENILVISGIPGTGKTRAANLYIKWLLKNPEVCKKFKLHDDTIEGVSDVFSFTVGYVKNEEVLAHDQFWETLTRFNPALVFLDDADYSLTSRKNEIQTARDDNKNKFLSQLLSFTDGITKNNTKFIITTNLEVADIDTAVLRKGRTFDILKFRQLKVEEAKSIWVSKGFNISYFNNNLPDSGTIPACDLGSAINKEENRIKNGKKIEPYLLEEGISILNKTKPTTVGFF